MVLGIVSGLLRYNSSFTLRLYLRQISPPFNQLSADRMAWRKICDISPHSTRRADDPIFLITHHNLILGSTPPRRTFSHSGLYQYRLANLDLFRLNFSMDTRPSWYAYIICELGQTFVPSRDLCSKVGTISHSLKKHFCSFFLKNKSYFKKRHKYSVSLIITFIQLGCMHSSSILNYSSYTSKFVHESIQTDYL